MKPQPYFTAGPSSVARTLLSAEADQLDWRLKLKAKLPRVDLESQNRGDFNGLIAVKHRTKFPTR